MNNSERIPRLKILCDLVKKTLPYGFGFLAAVSFSFHIQLAQNFLFYEKVLIILFFVIPFSMVFKILVTLIINSHSLLLISAISLAITIPTFIFFYKPIEPVRYHELEIYYPYQGEQANLNSFVIDRLEIKNNITVRLTALSLSSHGKYRYEGTKKGGNNRYYPESSLSFKIQFLGDLIVYLTPDNCPINLQVKFDNNEQIVDLCGDGNNLGTVFVGSSSGVISNKWLIFISIMKVIDFVLFTTIIILIVNLSKTRIKFKKVLSVKDESNPQKILFELRLLCCTSILVMFPAITYFLTGYMNKQILLPITIIIAFLWIEYIDRKLANKVIFYAIACVFVFGAIQNVLFVSTFVNFRSAFKNPISIASNAYNDLVVTKYRGLDSALKYGYRDVTTGRELYITKPANDTNAFFIDISNYQSLGITNVTVNYVTSELSESDFENLLSKRHVVWNDQDGHILMFLDIDYYSPGEPIILDYINGVYVFSPESLYKLEVKK